MNRIMGRLAILVALGLCSAQGAKASDIVCKAAHRGASASCEDTVAGGQRCAKKTSDRHPRAETLICDYALLSIGYDRIYAEQQRLLRNGAIRQADIVAWRKKRDACDSVNCMDDVFAQWHRYAAQRKSTRVAAQPKERVAIPLPAKPQNIEARSKPSRGEVAASLPPRQNPQAPAPLIVTQRSTEQAVRAPTTDTSLRNLPARAPVTPVASKPSPVTRGSFGALACAGVIGMGLAYRRTRKRHSGFAREHEPHAPVPAARLVVYALIALNLLLLLLALAPA